VEAPVITAVKFCAAFMAAGPVTAVWALVLFGAVHSIQESGAVRAAQAYCANLETVNCVGVGKAKVIGSFCWCNVTAVVISVGEDAVEQKLAELALA
jgi:hypothetical protein